MTLSESSDDLKDIRIKHPCDILKRAHETIQKYQADTKPKEMEDPRQRTYDDSADSSYSDDPKDGHRFNKLSSAVKVDSA